MSTNTIPATDERAMSGTAAFISLITPEKEVYVDEPVKFIQQPPPEQQQGFSLFICIISFTAARLFFADAVFFIGCDAVKKLLCLADGIHV